MTTQTCDKRAGGGGSMQREADIKESRRADWLSQQKCHRGNRHGLTTNKQTKTQFPSAPREANSNQELIKNHRSRTASSRNSLQVPATLHGIPPTPPPPPELLSHQMPNPHFIHSVIGRIILKATHTHIFLSLHRPLSSA